MVFTFKWWGLSELCTCFTKLCTHTHSTHSAEDEFELLKVKCVCVFVYCVHVFVQVKNCRRWTTRTYQVHSTRVVFKQSQMNTFVYYLQENSRRGKKTWSSYRRAGALARTLAQMIARTVECAGVKTCEMVRAYVECGGFTSYEEKSARARVCRRTAAKRSRLK